MFLGLECQWILIYWLTDWGVSNSTSAYQEQYSFINKLYCMQCDVVLADSWTAKTSLTRVLNQDLQYYHRVIHLHARTALDSSKKWYYHSSIFFQNFSCLLIGFFIGRFKKMCFCNELSRTFVWRHETVSLNFSKRIWNINVHTIPFLARVWHKWKWFPICDNDPAMRHDSYCFKL